MIKPYIYTVESVTSGHPDKVCDQISDAILDECLRQDPKSRVAMETFGAHGLLAIGGEVTTSAVFSAEEIAQKVYRDIGYKENLQIITNIINRKYFKIIWINNFFSPINIYKSFIFYHFIYYFAVNLLPCMENFSYQNLFRKTAYWTGKHIQTVFIEKELYSLLWK